MDALEGVGIAVVALAIFVAGALVGENAYDEGWKKDCQSMGMHRANGETYSCAKR